MAGRRMLVALVGVLALAASACGGGSGGTEVSTFEGEPVEFSPTAGFLAASADRSTEAGSFRFSAAFAMRMDAGFVDIDIEVDDYVVGEQAGAASHTLVDMGLLYEAMADELREFGAEDALAPLLARSDDMVLEVYEYGDELYLRAPIFGVLAEMAPNQGLPALPDVWVRADPGALGGAGAAAATNAAGGQGAEPDVFLELLHSVGGGVTELGPDEVDGVAVRTIEARVPMVDYFAQSGLTPEESLGLLSAFSSGGGAVERTLLEEMLASDVVLRVSVDGAGLVRRMSVEMDLGEAFASSGMGDLEASVLVLMDFSDYGADLDVTPPDEALSSPVDVSEVFASLLGGGGRALVSS